MHPGTPRRRFRGLHRGPASSSAVPAGLWALHASLLASFGLLVAAMVRRPGASWVLQARAIGTVTVMMILYASLGRGPLHDPLARRCGISRRPCSLLASAFAGAGRPSRWHARSRERHLRVRRASLTGPGRTAQARSATMAARIQRMPGSAMMAGTIRKALASDGHPRSPRSAAGAARRRRDGSRRSRARPRRPGDRRRRH